MHIPWNLTLNSDLFSYPTIKLCGSRFFNVFFFLNNSNHAKSVCKPSCTMRLKIIATTAAHAPYNHGRYVVLKMLCLATKNANICHKMVHFWHRIDILSRTSLFLAHVVRGVPNGFFIAYGQILCFCHLTSRENTKKKIPKIHDDSQWCPWIHPVSASFGLQVYI